MRPRFTMSIAIAVPLVLGAAGSAVAMTAGLGPQPIKGLLPPQPSPSSSLSLPKPLQKVASTVDKQDDDQGSTSHTSTNNGSTSASVETTAAGLETSGLGWAWNIPYGGWRRFFQPGEWPNGATQSYTATVPAPGTASSGTTTLAPVARSLPQTPAYLWLLLPFGLLTLWAAGLAVFEPIGDRGRLVLMIGSVRRTAKELPAGMTRSGARTAVRVFRRFGPWSRR